MIPDGVDGEWLALLARHAAGVKTTDSLETVRQKLNAEFLPHVDPRELHRRISAFRKLNFRAMSYGEVSESVSKVIMFNTANGSSCVIQSRNSLYPAGTMFYRVRAIPKDDHIIPLRSMSKVSDCWEPPREIVKAGRLNKEQEPLLYTTPIDPRVAIEELKIPDGEWFSLIVYEAVEDVNVTIIGGDVDTKGLDDEDALKVEMIQGFLCDEFTRDVGTGTEYLYRISEIIAKDYFDLPPVQHDAWCYPSIADKKCYNVAFRPSTRTKLRLIGVQIAKVYRRGNGEFEVRVGKVVKENKGSHDLAYFNIGSTEQQELFPFITTNNPTGVQNSSGGVS